MHTKITLFRYERISASILSGKIDKKFPVFIEIICQSAVRMLLFSHIIIGFLVLPNYT